MMTLIITSCIIAWIACGVLTYGATLAAFQRQGPSMATENYTKYRLIAAGMSLWGPVGLLEIFFMSDFFKHGFMWRRR
jgi:hypothetical protein